MATAPQNVSQESGNGFVFDPVTGEMVPANTTVADDIIKSSVPQAVPGNFSTTWDSESGTYGVWDNDTGTLVKRGLGEEEANFLAEEYSDQGGVLADTEILGPGAGSTISDPESSIPGSNTSASAVKQQGNSAAQRNIRQQEDWRLRLMLAPTANYLYNSAKPGDILYPLQATKGVIFPYTPSIQMGYRANYEGSDIMHTNYRYYFYKNSQIEEITITADFTAQDTTEANYMLAVLHFFKSVTKMFYGRDGEVGGDPAAGTPPPLCYLLGYGQYQFSDHPVLVSSISYQLPNDVDYIRAGSIASWGGQNLGSFTPSTNTQLNRLELSGLTKGGGISSQTNITSLSSTKATYVPTKMQLIITLLPIVTRGEIARTFSLKDYASGNLLKKGFW
jgi:hypothetical protein